MAFPPHVRPETYQRTWPELTKVLHGDDNVGTVIQYAGIRQLVENKNATVKYKPSHDEVRLVCLGGRFNDFVQAIATSQGIGLRRIILDKFAATTQDTYCHHGETAWTHQTTKKVLPLVHEHRRIPLEELVAKLPELTWNQVFSMVDELSRRRLISLRRRGFDYELWACSICRSNGVSFYMCNLKSLSYERDKKSAGLVTHLHR